MRYFTSDWHLNSIRTLTYAKRPFKDLAEEHKALLDSVNSLDKDDVVFHVGDFALTGKDRHGRLIDDATGWPTPEQHRAKVVPNFVLLSGNHDDSHNANTEIKCMIVELSRLFRNVTVGHHPSTHKDYTGLNGKNAGGRYSAAKTHVHICGHVHGSWLYCYDWNNDVLNVNVGVDVWGYKPVSDIDLARQIANVMRLQSEAGAFGKDWYWTPADRDAAFAEYYKKRGQEKERKRKERHEKLGLTPEECERRKQAGIRASKERKLVSIVKCSVETAKAALDRHNDDFKAALAELRNVA